MSQEGPSIYGISLRWIVIGICYLFMCILMYPDMGMPPFTFSIVMVLGAFWGWLLIVAVINPWMRFLEKSLAKIFRRGDDL